ncbi:MAG: alkaline phosphatase D family protein [Betaproteobacteria bacterium]
MSLKPLLGHGLHALWSAPAAPGSDGGRPQPWDVVIVGTGYGGSAAAAALAGCRVADERGGDRPIRLCILERGQEWRPGDFPSRMADLPGHLRIGQQTTGEVGGQAEGLFGVRVGDDVMALVANGVGGGSLINAGVLLEPQPNDLRRAHFATQVRGLQQAGWYQRARSALGGELQGRLNTIALHPEHASKPLAKAQALRTLAGRHLPVQEVPMTVAMTARPNAAGVELPGCTLCGDCMTGCNVGAKDSLDVNLLRQAVDAGAQLFTGASVSRLRMAADRETKPRWTLEVLHTRPDLQAREAGPLELHAHHVILAAGTFGSTEILLRSRDTGLPVSPRLGERFSCNGDNIAAVHRLPEAAHPGADESTDLDTRRVGPTITTAIAFGAQPQRGSRPFWLQEFSVPGAMRWLFQQIVTTGHAAHQLPQADLTRHGPGADPAADPAAVDLEAMERTLLVGLIGHDDSDGVLKLPHAFTSPPSQSPPSQSAVASSSQAPALGTLRVHWPQARLSPTLDTASAAAQRQVDHLRSLRQEAAQEDGKVHVDGPHWVPNPMWRLLPDELSMLTAQPRGPVLTVHPLGGCPMGESARDGVVDACGRVFDGRDAQGLRLLPGLAVLDGAIIPESLGANPSLTIAALALRGAQALRADWGLITRPAPGPSAAQGPAAAPALPRPMGPPRPPLPGQTRPQPTLIGVIERLTGPVWLDLGDRPGGARPWVVEWTLEYQPARLDALAATLDRRLQVDEASAHSRVRLYEATTWEDRGLAGQADEVRHRHAVLEATVSGSLRFLHREDSFALQRIARGLRAWVRHRGLRDLYQRFTDPGPQVSGGLGSMVTGLLRTASRAGEVRRFDYDLRVEEVLRCTLSGADGRPSRAFLRGDVLQGHKRLTYAVAGNPWRQLTELHVTQMPGMPASGPRCGGTLVLDPRFLAGRQTPLLRIVDQQDQVQALADLAGFGLTMLRLLASIHLWTFRKPDTPLTREPVRLPQPIAGLPPPQITEWAVAPARQDRPAARVRLTRYPPPAGASPAPALVMIHGYSVSGNTFTHESLRPSAAEWFHRQGRDVWVLDLRSSSGLPTATVPWTLEEVALVDIPAALLHVRQVTGAPVDVLAHCIGCVMMSMALLSRPQELQERARTLDRPAPLDTAQQAALAAFNGAGGEGQPHPTVRRMVLSQKGPVLRYTDANVLRGWVMQFARRWLLRDGFQFRPSAQPGAGEQLMDRLLASLPYPDADWRVENPLWPWRRTPWTATRHRMDVLYGRDFEATGLSRATLEAIDDLFGPIHLDTVSQTIHFTLADQATDHSGAGDYVTPQRLRERWSGIETLALHGRENGLADVFTQRLLGLHLGAAGVPVIARTFAGMGHQDLLIGQRSAQVFAEVERFLRQGVVAFGAPVPVVQAQPESEVQAQPAAAQADAVIRPPWLGPRLDVLAPPRHKSGTTLLRVAAMPPLDAGLARLALVPVRHTAQGWCVAQGRFGLSRAPGRSRQWQFVHAGRLVQTRITPGGEASQPSLPDGWLALMVYPQAEQCDLPMDLPWPGLDGPPPLPPSAPAGAGQASGGRIHHALNGIRRWLQSAGAEDIEACLVPRQALERLADRLHQPGATPHDPAVPQAPARVHRVHLAVGSCQYPYGPLDRAPAQASLQRMAQRADQGDLDLALFLGDQIYADATAGLVDPTRRDERYEIPHERAQRAPGMRRVLARLPSVMLLDDHELVDNWEPCPPGADPALPVWRGRQDALIDGRWGYWKYERMRPQLRHQPQRDLADKDFRFAGLPIYLADTRTGRQARSATTPSITPHILSTCANPDTPGQFEQLEAWLLQHRNEPKVVATPSMLLPRRAEGVQDPGAEGRSDAWDGYPASLDRLLDFLMREQIQYTVFLSGDEHHALVCEVTLQPPQSREHTWGPVQLTSVHSSALYAPLPFANGHPAELSDQAFVTAGGTRVTMSTRCAPPGDGWARISLTPGTGSGDLEVEFVKAHPVQDSD